MEQQNNTNNNSNTLMYLGIAGAGVLIALLIAYLAWPSSSDKKEEERSSSKDKTVQQKSGTATIKSAAKAVWSQAEIKNKQKEIRKDLGSMVNYKFSWSTFIQNHLTIKIITTLAFHFCMGYCFQVPAGSNKKDFWRCFYSSVQEDFSFNPVHLTTISASATTLVSAARMTIVFTAVQFIASSLFFVFLSSLACDLGFVNLTSEQIKEQAIAQEEFTLKEQTEGEQSKTFLKECQEAKKTFAATCKAAEEVFKKEEVALNEKAAKIETVEELEKAISAAQQAMDKAKTEKDTNEKQKQKAILVVLNKKLAYAKAVAANNKVKKDKQATAQQKKAAKQKVAKAKDGLKTPEYEAAKTALDAHKAHADFLQNTIDTMEELSRKVKKVQTSVQQEVAQAN